jgi:hypothetical protein
VLAAPSGAAAASSESSTSGSQTNLSPLGGSGTTNYLPIWTNSTTLGNSVLFQAGTGSSAKVGFNTATPASTLDVNGKAIIRGLFSLPATGAATSASGKNSQPEDFIASSFNSSTHAAVSQTFQWQAESAGNNTSSPTGTLNLLFGSGTSAPAETGLKISNKGIFSFAPGQKLPGTGPITGVTAGIDLTGGGTSGTITPAQTQMVLVHRADGMFCQGRGEVYSNSAEIAYYPASMSQTTRSTFGLQQT